MRNYRHIFELLLIFLAVALLFPILPVSSSAEETLTPYLGQLHNHSGNQDDLSMEGYGPGYAFSQAKTAGMDFYALTDFSHSFQEDAWSQGKTAADTASDGTFTAMYGYEAINYRDPFMDHIAVFDSSGVLTWEQEKFLKVEDMWDALVSDPKAIGMFCHPDPVHGDFAYLDSYRWDYDNHMPLFEVVGQYGETFYDAYQTALVKGWHVSPTASAGTHEGGWADSNVRTGILASENRSEALLEGLRSRRTYATTDPGLHITYQLGGHIMGSRLTALENYQITLQISNPQGSIRIITEEGTLLKDIPAETAMAFSVEPGHRFYYVCMEKDGKTIAITAPVWVEPPTKYGATDLTASVSVPVQGEEVDFSFSLFSREPADMTVSSITLTADSETIWESTESTTISLWQSRDFTIPCTYEGVGETEFVLNVSGTIGGKAFDLQKTLRLSYRPKILNAHILVDGRHSSVSYDQLKSLTTLASEADMDVGIFRYETPENAKVMILPPLEADFEESYPQLLISFVENGGCLILCGQMEDNHRANALLEAMGSTLRFCNDTARDPVNNGGVPESMYTDVFNDSVWEGLTGDEVYSQQFGCTVDPGKGIWLVKGRESMGSPVLLARESLGKGTVIAAGSFLWDDEHLILPRNLWDTPSGNQLLLESILEIQRIQLPISEIKTVRGGTLGEIYRVTGYVTAGTSKEHNRFPKMIYLQDGTGGIEITAFSMPDIQVGFSLDITGQLHMDGKNPALKLISCRCLENDLYRHDPAVTDHKTAMDYENHGAELMKIEGRAEAIQLTADGLGVRRFTLRDENGDAAVVLVEDYIRSGTDGVNHLAKQVMDGEMVRAYGILHLEADGTPVLRVRNCDEVVYIPPIPEKPEKETSIPDLSNPNTGDPFAKFFTFLHI